ncbi:MAG: sugar diacid recognition domain-containing protein [Bacilli bacterium]
MQIDKRTGEKITYELHKILKTHVNIISVDGIITSSTDSEQVGQYHKVAHDAAIENDIKVQYDNSIENVFAGVNIPIEFEYKVISVIGITGNPNNYATIARVAKSLTETLIKELYFSNRKNYIENEMKSIIEMIILRQDGFLNIKLNKFFHNTEKFIFASISGTDDTINQLYGLLRKNRNVCLSKIGSSLVTLSNDDSFYINQLQNTDLDFKIGFGETKYDMTGLSNSYFESISSLRVCEKYNIHYCPYNHLKTELLINTIPNAAKLKLLERFFSNLDTETLSEMTIMYMYYFESNRSLKDTAENFFIHRNTVKYRLERFSKKTSLNYMDNVEAALLYYMCRIYNDKDTHITSANITI